MSTVGMMDGTFFVSKTELLRWANQTFQLNLSKVEQCGNGAVYCQVIDCCHPGTVPMKKVNWNARADHEAIPNYKVLQQALNKNGISRHVDVDKLIRGKYQDNLEMLQWIKTYFEVATKDRSCEGGVYDYDGPSRRFCDRSPDWAQAQGVKGGGGGYVPQADSRSTSYPSAPRQPAQAPNRVAPKASPVRAASTGVPRASAAGLRQEHEDLKEDYEKLREEIVDLKITVDGLETERDFYFQKLRDIEILSQALEATPNPDMTVGKFVEDVQRILYAKDDEDDGLPQDS